MPRHWQVWALCWSEVSKKTKWTAKYPDKKLFSREITVWDALLADDARLKKEPEENVFGYEWNSQGWTGGGTVRLIRPDGFWGQCPNYHYVATGLGYAGWLFSFGRATPPSKQICMFVRSLYLESSALEFGTGFILLCCLHNDMLWLFNWHSPW